MKFRDEWYRKKVFLGKRTVKEGEACIRWNLLGESRVLYGPRRKWFYRSTIQFLTRHTASSTEYLVVVNRDGRKVHMRGPCSLFANPVEHRSVTKQNAIVVDANKCIVVFKEGEDHSVHRRVVKGPLTFFPDPNEWPSEFSWHGADPSEPMRFRPNAAKHTVLDFLTHSMVVEVKDVRTSDDVKLTVRVMLSYSLGDVERMLATTQDPIGDMINAVCADVISLAAQVDLETFVAQSGRLSDVSTYRTLVQRTAAIGFNIHKVVYFGYSSPTMQSLQDSALQARARQRIQIEIQQQNMALEEYTLQKKTEIADKERQLAQLELQHKLEIESLEADAQARRRADEARLQEAHDEAMNQAQADFLKGMRECNVDLTRFLVAQEVQKRMPNPQL